MSETEDDAEVDHDYEASSSDENDILSVDTPVVFKPTENTTVQKWKVIMGCLA